MTSVGRLSVAQAFLPVPQQKTQRKSRHTSKIKQRVLSLPRFANPRT
jgi:hypothetical protein